jgi:hypothetical protein
MGFCRFGLLISILGYTDCRIRLRGYPRGRGLLCRSGSGGEYPSPPTTGCMAKARGCEWRSENTTAEVRCQGEQVDCARQIEPLGGVWSGEQSPVDPMRAPPSAVLGRWHFQEATLTPAQLSSNAVTMKTAPRLSYRSPPAPGSSWNPGRCWLCTAPQGGNLFFVGRSSWACQAASLAVGCSH